MMLLFTLLFALAVSTRADHVVDHKTWMFAIDELHGVELGDDGTVTGFMPDFIQGVCKLAGKDCDTTVQPRYECGETYADDWFPESGISWFPGRGLMSGWFDVCTWRAVTQERLNSVEFSRAFMDAPNGRFAVKSGNPHGFDPHNIAGAKIAVFSGTHNTPFCIEHLYGQLGAHYIIAESREDAAHKVESGEVDAMFTFIDLDKHVDFFPADYKCHSDGMAMMSKKGSGFTSWWDAAFQDFVDSGCMKFLCEKYDHQGGIISCEQFHTDGNCDTSVQNLLWGHHE